MGTVPRRDPTAPTNRALGLGGVVALLAVVAAATIEDRGAVAPAAERVRAAPAERPAPVARPQLPEPQLAAPRLPEANGVLGAADGAVPAGTTVFDDAVPGVARLDPALLGALRLAATSATADGQTLTVNSGWRSPAYQDELRRQAVAKYGSADEAARWVASPATSEHVAGNAVDIGPTAAADWLGTHGAAFGLCRIYANEPWHFELRPDAAQQGCPAPFADPTHDPRTRP